MFQPNKHLQAKYHYHIHGDGASGLKGLLIF